MKLITSPLKPTKIIKPNNISGIKLSTAATSIKYKNRDGDATKTDFFLDPTGTKYFNQYIQ